MRERYRSCLILFAVVLVGCGSADSSGKLQSESVVALLDVMDAVALDERDEQELERRIDTFLDTKAMRIYFGRFRNVTPEHYRRAFRALPDELIDAPGDIAKPFHEMLPIRHELRSWVDRLVVRIDVGRCREAALRWLPEGDYPTPEMFLVYDNNAGSYTARGKAFYNLYSGENPRTTSVDEMEAVISHEMHHVLARPLYDDASRSHSGWERAAMDRVIRGMVSEGAAIHCNPPTGFRKALWEDPRTVEALIAELNGELSALADGRVEEAEFRTWYSATFHELPMRLFREYLAREYAEDEIEDLVARHASQRPDLLHALGWWMVSRVSDEGRDETAVRELVTNPYQLFDRYNAALGPEAEALAVRPWPTTT